LTNIKNKLLRGIFLKKREEITEGRRKLHNEKYSNQAG
jgi:hypothetical protein